MSSISGTDGAAAGLAGAGGQATPSVGSNKLGENEFVSLLMAQMQNQDPTQPQSSEAFVAQLAQFANLQLNQAAGDTMQQLLLAQTAGNQTSVASLVGKDVAYQSPDFDIKDGKSPKMAIELGAPAADVVVTVKDSSGKVVRTEHLPNAKEGKLDYEYNGLDDAGNPLPDGKYSIEVVANGADGKPVDSQFFQYGSVDGVSFADGAPELLVGQLRIKLADVVEVLDANTTTDTTTTAAQQPAQGESAP